MILVREALRGVGAHFKSRAYSSPLGLHFVMAGPAKKSVTREATLR